jgi:phosphotransacetylase
MSILAKLRIQSAQNPRRIVFPEQHDPRVVTAARTIVAQGIAVPVFLEPADETVDGVEIFSTQPGYADVFEQAAQALTAARAKKGMTIELARASLAQNPLLLGALLLRIGHVDAGIAGSLATTADV